MHGLLLLIMKKIGLIGGITWHSSLDYYRYMNQLVNEQLGGDHSARVLLNSIDFGEIKRLTFAGDWDGIFEIIKGAAGESVQAGADCIMLGANTMHHIADRLEVVLPVPLIHIADATAKAIQEKGLDTVALLGTKYTMEFAFFRDRLAANGIHAIIPDETGITFVNDSIYQELGKGIFREETRSGFRKLINQLVNRGAAGVILGCTEIPMLISQDDVPIPVFDTTKLHARAAVEFSLG